MFFFHVMEAIFISEMLFYKEVTNLIQKNNRKYKRKGLGECDTLSRATKWPNLAFEMATVGFSPNSILKHPNSEENTTNHVACLYNYLGDL